MPKPIANIRFDAAAPISASPVTSSPVSSSTDDTAVFVRLDQQFPAITEPNNPVLTREQGTNASKAGTSTGVAVVGGSALLAALMGSAGCADQGTLAIAAIGIGWGLATVGAWGGILLGLNKLAGWFDCGRVSGENIGRHIKRGDWERIQEALLDDSRDSKELATIQASLLNVYDRIPAYMQSRICKAVAAANGDSKHATNAIDRLLKTNKQLEQTLYTLADIMLAHKERPNGVVGAHIAKTLIKLELRQQQSVQDPMLALAVALTSDRKDCETLVGILAIRVKLGFARTNEDLINAIGWLRQKPFGPDVCQQSLLPLLVDIEGVDVGI